MSDGIFGGFKGGEPQTGIFGAFVGSEPQTGIFSGLGADEAPVVVNVADAAQKKGILMGFLVGAAATYMVLKK